MESSLLSNWPESLRDYEPIEVLSVGRMSTVVRARQTDVEREVAIKVMHAHLAGTAAFRRRLRREFAAVRRLDHPAIVGAEKLVDDGETAALVMEYVDGESVRRRVKGQGPMPWKKVRPVVADVLAALEHAHERGIWHRDLNAEHVLVDSEGRGRVVGFGLARVDELAALTMHTQVLGALEAMAPERVLGVDYDGRADLYSVGAVAYEMLRGHPLIDGTMHAAFVRARGEGRAAEEDLPEELAPQARYVLERALAIDASARFATPQQMRRALDGVYDEELWREWIGRKSRHCPDCEAPVIEGLAECVECGHELDRLIGHPGDGDWRIRILTPRDAFQPDVWFEKNMEPRHLPTETYDRLVTLLESYDDIREIVEWHPEYRLPPYILFDRVVAVDARRVSELLDDRGIPHVVERATSEESGWRGRMRRWADVGFKYWGDFRSRGGWRGEMRRGSVADGSSEGCEATGADESLSSTQPSKWAMALSLLLAVWMAPVAVPMNFVASHKKLIAMLVLATALGGYMLLYLFGMTMGAESTGLEEAFEGDGFLMRSFMVTVGLLWGSAFAFRGLLFGLRRREWLRSDRRRIDGYELMIAPEDLRRVGGASSGMQLPERTARVWKGLEDDGVRREVYELIALAIAVEGRSDEVAPQSLEAIIDDVLTLGEVLDEALREAAGHTTAELYAELEGLELRDDSGDDNGADERRDELLEALERHDDAVSKVTRLKSAMQRCRGMLFDLMSDEVILGVEDPQLVLNLEEEVERARVEDEALREVEEL